MPKRIPLVTIVVQRPNMNNGKPFSPEINKPFDFTQAELDDIKKVMPNAVRHIINEDADSAPAAAVKKPEPKTPKESKGKEKGTDNAGTAAGDAGTAAGDAGTAAGDAGTANGGAEDL